MENREQQILSEIKAMMTSIRSQLERLDAKMAELQQAVNPEEFESDSVDLEIDDVVPVEPVMELSVPDEDLPFADVPEEEDDDLPAVFDEPVYEEPVPAVKASESAAPILNDVMAAADYAWRRDMPGTPVKDIRSAISLNDRVIFINLLFNEDAQTFVNVLTDINSMEALDQVVEYVRVKFPDWDLASDLVYRFMMAVRRKVK